LEFEGRGRSVLSVITCLVFIGSATVKPETFESRKLKIVQALG
jgi:hypothetical protein